jgi:hypothetical protein
MEEGRIRMIKFLMIVFAVVAIFVAFDNVELSEESIVVDAFWDAVCLEWVPGLESEDVVNFLQTFLLAYPFILLVLVGFFRMRACRIN